MSNFIRRDVKILNLDVNEVFTAQLYAIRQTQYGPHFIFKNEDGELFLLYGKRILEQNIFAADIGNTFMIRYGGKQKSEKGNEYHTYDIGVCYTDGVLPYPFIEAPKPQKGRTSNGKQQHASQTDQTSNQQNDLPF